MYLRQRNNDIAAQQRQLVLEQRISRLKAAILPAAVLGDALARLELAEQLCWQGTYHPTLKLVDPLLDQCFPLDIRFKACQVIADTHFRHDQYDLANRAYHQNLTEASDVRDEYWQARAKEGLAWVLIDVGQYATGEFEEAGRMFEESLSFHRKHARPVSEAMALYGLSRAVAGKGRYDVAMDLALESISVLESASAPHLLQLPLLQIANIYRDDGDFDRAYPYYDMAIDAADRSQDPYFQVLTVHHFGLLKKFMGDVAGAFELWNSILPMIGDLDFPRLGCEMAGELSVLAANRGDFEAAYRLQIESRDYGNRVGVISPILQNQQMTLRTAMHQTGQLENKLNYLTAGVEASEDGIFVLGPPNADSDRTEFVTYFANTAAAQMLGKTPVEITHVPITTVWKSPSVMRLLDPSREVFETGKRRSLFPVQLEFKDGEARWYAVKIAKIPDGVAWTVIDVTERETMRQEIVAQRDRLAEANERLTALDREKSEVLGIAAHDLRSPIANIHGLSDVILHDASKAQEAAAMIGSTAESLLGLIANLLDVERIECGKFELNIAPTFVNPILAGIVSQFNAAAEEKNIDLKLILEVDPPGVLVDLAAFQRVVENLLSNAVKFSPPGSTVEIRTLSCEAFVRVEVVDQGPGISPVDREQLFGKFVRLSARPTAGESSSGLGLSIVKHLVISMNGRVGCDSILGHGANFRVDFPIS
jgi:signal transduction histidine kinase/tetratricopeptide (TPR) repeat protein